VREPIRFAIAKEFVPLHTFPSDAREFGSERFLRAARHYFEQAFGPGTVTVAVAGEGLDITWMPEDALLDPFEYAIELLRKRQHALAIPMLTSLLKDHPGDVALLFNLGMAESDLGLLDDAIMHLQRAVDTDPSHAHARVALGVAHGRAGRTKEAIATLRQAVTSAPDDPYARRNLGALLGRDGDIEGAEVHLREAARLLPNDQPSLYGLAHLLIQLGDDDRMEEADTLFQRAIDLDPDNDIAELCRTERSRIAAVNFRAAGGGLRLDAVMYCVGAMKTFGAMALEDVEKVTFEIAILGMQGLDVNDPTQKYSLRSLPGRFSGLHLVSIMYVGMKLIDPTADTGFDLSKEYQQAQGLSGLAGEPKS
jgi:Flp pilus assembly protein TadD